MLCQINVGVICRKCGWTGLPEGFPKAMAITGSENRRCWNWIHTEEIRCDFRHLSVFVLDHVPHTDICQVLLENHPQFKVILITADRKAGLPIASVFPHLATQVSPFHLLSLLSFN